MSRNNLAVAYFDAGRFSESAALNEQVLRAREAALGPDHPDTLMSRNNLALVYLNAGRPAESIPLLEAVLEAREAWLGPDHPDTIGSYGNAAVAYRNAGPVRAALRGWSRRSGSRNRGSVPATPSRSRASPTWPPPTRCSVSSARPSR